VERDNWPALWFSQDAAARLVVGRDLTVLVANSHALSVIENNCVLGLREGALTARDRKAAAELATVLAEAGPQARFAVVGADGGAAVLVEAFTLGEGADAPVALALRDLSTPVQIECADLESMFGVTPGERQVIVQLLKGYSSREIAEDFGKSILTVRTHVKRAYGKIGVKTRGQLFARLLPYLSIR
jgi:DNA-binding CsgD family transcriptional regulator